MPLLGPWLFYGSLRDRLKAVSVDLRTELDCFPCVKWLRSLPHRHLSGLA